MNYLNLDVSNTADTAKALNILLADYHLYYQKLRNFHWNIVGENFFDLHAKFEELYNDAKLKIDEIAERMLTLRFQPESNFSNYLELSNLAESSSDLGDFKMVKTLLSDHKKIIDQMRKVVDSAEQNDDEGTIDLIGEYIRELEKTSWMLDAWILRVQEKQYS
ncbi:DNA starvation/stationary phase protection protein [Psychroflexus sp. YR1-1]|uniref:DNA starvation/stationary phase protection protein n=1 Tax=Psychroflexus aurantiacus TaxID=2709310 RepID=A0A6B3R9X3_9FLAO|nr:DNA starvation/stationary phase protection protein [Psychroflexus aurantiacus]NEV94364.1 DNA starvation/stationary phase protection protein [Psychroflexus aurantiacus]